jgi:hypothetical protein
MSRHSCVMMVSMITPWTLGLGAVVGVLAFGCLGPNPFLDAGGTDTDTTGDGDGDTTDDTIGDGDGDGDTTGDGDGDGDGDPCSNGNMDPGETGLDCGGTCGPCEDGEGCLEADDCVSLVCLDEICQVPSCDDEVHNGDELLLDCGGSCKFCEHSTFLTELDAFNGSPARFPQVSMFSDLSFAVTYTGPMQGRARWFDEVGEPSGPDTELWSDITYSAGTPIHVNAGEADTHDIHVVEPGLDMMSINSDLFLVQRDPSTEILKFLINSSNDIVNDGDLSVEGNRATLAWVLNDVVLVRRFDYDMSDWTDVQPFEADTDTDTYSGAQPVVSRNANGVIAVAWVRCNAMDGVPCSVMVRRFDTNWIDQEPVIVTPTSEYFLNPQVAIADDGRIAVVWCRLDIGNTEIWARLLTADLQLDGEAWPLQTGLPVASYSDVAALGDGSFVFGWPDVTQDSVHLRRFIGPNEPKLPEFGDEAPWPATISPDGVSIATVDNHVVIVWSAVVDMIAQIQGQVLSF